MARTLSIRSRLVGILLLVIVVFGGATLLISMLIARRAVRTLSHELIARQADGVADQLEGFFAPVRGAIDIGEAWGKEGILDPDQPERLRALLQPVLERFKQMSAALVADDRGREFMLLRTGGRWITRQTRRDEWGARVKWTEDGKEEWREIDYDPRSRPWFQGAMERRDKEPRVFWTDPYRFFSAPFPPCAPWFSRPAHASVPGRRPAWWVACCP